MNIIENVFVFFFQNELYEFELIYIIYTGIQYRTKIFIHSITATINGAFVGPSTHSNVCPETMCYMRDNYSYNADDFFSKQKVKCIRENHFLYFDV